MTDSKMLCAAHRVCICIKRKRDTLDTSHAVTCCPPASASQPQGLHPASWLYSAGDAAQRLCVLGKHSTNPGNLEF